LDVEQAIVAVGEPDGGDSVEAFPVIPPTISFPNVGVSFLQPDGNFSLIAQAGIDGEGVTAFGVMLDIDPAAIIPGSTLSIPTSTLPVSVPYTASQLVFGDGVLVRRAGLIFDGEFFLDEAMAGVLPVCDIPGADKYGTFFLAADSSGAGVGSITDLVPTSIDVTIPDLVFGGVIFDSARQSLSWDISGSDLSGLDMGEVTFEWLDPVTFGDRSRTFLVAGDATSLKMPSLPADLSMFDPPPDADLSVEFLDLDNVSGFDDFVISISAVGGNLPTLALMGSRINLVFGGQ
jgi:hypothetical protein